MIIDGHGHACGSYYDEYSIINKLKEENIDMVVLCPGEEGSKRDYYYPMLSRIIKNDNVCFAVNKFITFVIKKTKMAKGIDNENKRVYNLTRNFPDKIIQAYWVNPVKSSILKDLDDDYEKYRFKMLKMHQCWNDFDILSPIVLDIFNWAAEKNIPVFIHLISKEQIKRFVELSNVCKDTKIIIAHMIGFKEINDNSKSDNIYFDISSPQLITDRTLKKALDSLGSSKLILGSDTPYGKRNITLNINRLSELGISKDDIDNIVYKNIYNLLFSK